MNRERIIRLASAVAAAALVAACGGGGDGEPDGAPAASDAVPAAASQSAEGLVDWLRALALEADAADAKQPLDLSAFEPPTVDDREPLPVR